MKKVLLGVVLGIFLIMGIIVPTSVFADNPNNEIKKNVEKLWQPLKESQVHVTAVEFKKVQDSKEDFVLIDTRRKAEYDAAHIPGAIHVDRGVLEWVAPTKIKKTDETIYVYCRTGARGAFVTQRLTEMGYSNVINIYDAFKGWVLAGYPVYNRHGEFILSPDSFEKKESKK